jgi:hypothetical protein
MAIRNTRKVNNTKSKEKQNKPKTFKTEELANLWAKENGISKYKLENIRHLGAKDKKIRVITE